MKDMEYSMRPTLIIYAHPQTFSLLARDCYRFAGTRRSIFARLYAAYLVFVGRADALSWDSMPNRGERMY